MAPRPDNHYADRPSPYPKGRTHGIVAVLSHELPGSVERHLGLGLKDRAQMFGRTLHQLGPVDGALQSVEKVLARLGRGKAAAETQPVQPDRQLAMPPGSQQHDRQQRRRPCQGAEPGAPNQVRDPLQPGHNEDKIQREKEKRNEDERSLLDQNIEEREALHVVSDGKEETQGKRIPKQTKPAGMQLRVQEAKADHYRTERDEAAALVKFERAASVSSGNPQQRAAPHGGAAHESRKNQAGTQVYPDVVRQGLYRADRIQGRQTCFPAPAKRHVFSFVVIDKVKEQRRNQQFGSVIDKLHQRHPVAQDGTHQFPCNRSETQHSEDVDKRDVSNAAPACPALPVLLKRKKGHWDKQNRVETVQQIQRQIVVSAHGLLFVLPWARPWFLVACQPTLRIPGIPAYCTTA